MSWRGIGRFIKHNATLRNVTSAVDPLGLAPSLLGLGKSTDSSVDPNAAFASSGLAEFMGGRAYAPERILSLFDQQYQGPKPQDVQRATNPSITEAQRYGQGAMDLAGRGAAIQTGTAAQGLGGLNPAARAQALMDISRSASANVGNAGVQGYGQGLQTLQQTQGMNQQAEGMNQNSALTQRAQALGLFGGSLDRTRQAGSDYLQLLEANARRKQEEEDQQNQQTGQLLKGAASVLPFLL
jgi:hypothetical protein